jgi:hypothetical protein
MSRGREMERGRSCRMEKVRKRYPCLWKVAIG